MFAVCVRRKDKLMEFIVSARILCQCIQSRCFAESYAPEDFEDFKPEEFEDAAVDNFKNHGWTRVGVTDEWLCPKCEEK